MSKYVKFSYARAREDIAPFDELPNLNAWRKKLRLLGLVGVDSKGIGFGNLSIRDSGTSNFYITGSASGSLPELTPADCVRVVAYDFSRNWLSYEGATIPSSESLTHAAIYESDSITSAVIHCHDSVLWQTLLDRVPTTSKTIAYGTPEMAYEVIRLFGMSDVRSEKIFVMTGHHAGIVTFGKNLEEAFQVLMRVKRNIPCIKHRFLHRNLSCHEG